MKIWANNGIDGVESHSYTDEAALLATEFRKDNPDAGYIGWMSI